MKFKFAEIPLEGENPDISMVQLMRTGSFDYWSDGSKLEITPEMFRSFKANFDAKTLGVDIAIDYFHNSHNEAAGWIKELILKEGDTQLWLKVEWTDVAREKILSKEIRYLSADFTVDWKDSETGKMHGPTLLGGGLTNRPFLKKMSAILHDLTKIEDGTDDDSNSFGKPNEGNAMKLTDLIQHAVMLSDAEKRQLAEKMNLQLSDPAVEAENKDLRVKLAEKESEVKTLSEKVASAEKEAEFNVLLSEGKAVPAQKDAYLKGDMKAFLAQAVSVNLDGKGSGEEPGKKAGADPKTAQEADERIAQLAEEMVAKNPKLSIVEAQRKVLSENLKLKELINA